MFLRLIVFTGVFFCSVGFTATTAPKKSTQALRVLKAGESYLFSACEDTTAGNATDDINNALAAGKIVTGSVEIDPPFAVSAPAYSGVGDSNSGFSWCAAVVITKQ